jgi:hypothetical protein
MARDDEKKNNPHKFYWPRGSVLWITVGTTIVTLLITLCVVWKSRKQAAEQSPKKESSAKETA